MYPSQHDPSSESPVAGTGILWRKTVSITACTAKRHSFLYDEKIVSAFVAILAECAAEWHCVVPIYCFTPDHMHLLIQGIDEASRPMYAVEKFKLRSGLWLEKKLPDCDWQHEFYDHLVRKSDDWIRQAFYILNNPVRKGLVEDPFLYSFTGSIGCDLRALFDDLSP